LFTIKISDVKRKNKEEKLNNGMKTISQSFNPEITSVWLNEFVFFYCDSLDIYLSLSEINTTSLSNLGLIID